MTRIMTPLSWALLFTQDPCHADLKKLPGEKLGFQSRDSFEVERLKGAQSVENERKCVT